MDRSIPLGSRRGHSLAHLQNLTPEAFMPYQGERLQDEATSLQSLCTLRTAQTCLTSQCKAVTTGHREGTAHFCAALPAPPERSREWTRRGKSGEIVLSLCHWEVTPGGLSAADIFRIIFMLLQSGAGSKSKIQKVSSVPSWSLTFFTGDDYSEVGTLALILAGRRRQSLCRKQQSFWVSCAFAVLGNRQ